MSEIAQKRLSNRKVLWGVSAACVAGLAFGAVMRPDLAEDPKTRGAERVVEIPKEPDPRDLQILVSRPPEPEPVEQLAPDPQPADAAAPEPEPRVYARPAPEPAPPPVVATARPSFDCRYARSRAEQMICTDRGLAAADRRMARAFARAERAGVPHQVLRRQQDVWLAAREDAARDHPAAVRDVYEARIAELEEMARY